MDEKNKDIKSEDLMAQEPSLAEMPLTEHKEVDYTFGKITTLVILIPLRNWRLPWTMQMLSATIHRNGYPL